jgi:hypothetical protein
MVGDFFREKQLSKWAIGARNVLDEQCPANSLCTQKSRTFAEKSIPWVEKRLTRSIFTDFCEG